MINIFSSKKKNRLEGRVALITGASRGIGAAVAKAYAKEGAHVILLARTVGSLEEVDDAIQAEGGKATLLPFNLSEVDKIHEIGPAIADRFKKLDILVGNAGVLGGLSPVAMSDDADWQYVMNVNFFANYQLIRNLDPFLRGSDAGRAIFVSSGAAHTHKPFWGAYAASKIALEEMVKTYAAEVANTTLKVNIVDPGRVRTAMRAEAVPGEDPLILPEPESIVESFIKLADPSFKDSGVIIKAA